MAIYLVLYDDGVIIRREQVIVSDGRVTGVRCFWRKPLWLDQATIVHRFGGLRKINSYLGMSGVAAEIRKRHLLHTSAEPLSVRFEYRNFPSFMCHEFCSTDTEIFA